LFFVSVLVSTLYGGLGPRLLSGALACIAARYFFPPPQYSFALEKTTALQLGIFGVEAVIISWLIASRMELSLRLAALVKHSDERAIC
jgi:K+-sensing histidine kinase KdpD